MAQFVAIAGLPRSGSTLLCQLLLQHSKIGGNGASSPVCNALLHTRRDMSTEPFMLAQLDNLNGYEKLKSSMQGFLRGWNASDEKKQVVIDKNRGWLNSIEFLLEIEPDAKLVICIRDLSQIYGSIEAQHQKTILLDHIDYLAGYDRGSRVNALFSPDKTIGQPLNAIFGIPDLPISVLEHIYFVPFEELMSSPQKTVDDLCKWIGVETINIDVDNLIVSKRESDSHYHMKYLHTQQTKIMKPKFHVIPQRIDASIKRDFIWFYQTYYPKKSQEK